MSTNISTVGIVITALNVLILILLSTNIIKSYNRATDINKAVSKSDVDFYFLQMLNSMIFFVANGIALYTGILTFVIRHYDEFNSIILWRLADRTGMLVTSVMLILIRVRYNPFKVK